jgi:hypothetical protein
METAVLVGVILAAGLLMASGVWVGLVLIAAVIRIKPSRVTAKLKAPGGDDSVVSRPAGDRV